jgi:hypothetical protein
MIGWPLAVVTVESIGATTIGGFPLFAVRPEQDVSKISGAAAARIARDEVIFIGIPKLRGRFRGLGR